MPIFHWNPGCLYLASIIPSFLELGLVCFNFSLVILSHLIQTVHIQPCLLIHSGECEPLEPTSVSISMHCLAPYLFLHDSLNHREQMFFPLTPFLTIPATKTPLPNTANFSSLLGWRCVIFMLVSRSLQGVVLMGHARLYENLESRISFLLDVESRDWDGILGCYRSERTEPIVLAGGYA